MFIILLKENEEKNNLIRKLQCQYNALFKENELINNIHNNALIEKEVNLFESFFLY